MTAIITKTRGRKYMTMNVNVSFITAHIQKKIGKGLFSQVSVCQQGGVPQSQVLSLVWSQDLSWGGGGVTAVLTKGGTSVLAKGIQGHDRGTPLQPGTVYPLPMARTGVPPRQRSTVSTCYVTDSTPLAVTQ